MGPWEATEKERKLGVRDVGGIASIPSARGVPCPPAAASPYLDLSQGGGSARHPFPLLSSPASSSLEIAPPSPLAPRVKMGLTLSPGLQGGPRTPCLAYLLATVTDASNSRTTRAKPRPGPLLEVLGKWRGGREEGCTPLLEQLSWYFCFGKKTAEVRLWLLMALYGPHDPAVPEADPL